MRSSVKSVSMAAVAITGMVIATENPEHMKEILGATFSALMVMGFLC